MTTRTLIIAGFSNSEELENYKNTVFNPDKMVEYYIITQSNLLFLIFYDLRESIKFFNNFKNEELYISYTISKYELPKKNEECSEKCLQSTIIFNFKNIEVKIEDNFVSNFLKQYGEIKSVKTIGTAQKNVEFYDIRDAKKAFNALNNSPFGTGEIVCSWSWDIPVGTRLEYIKKTDDFIKSHMQGESMPKRSKIENNKIEVNKIENSSNKKNMFIALFDKFIAENIVEIDKIFR